MPRFALQVLALFLVAVTGTSAATAPASPSPTAPDRPQRPATESTVAMLRERVLQMTEFFDTVLPGTLGADNITLHANPKLTDVRDREFVRMPIEVRYGATNRLELIGGITPFVPNPINGGRDHRWGPGEAKLAARYDLGSRLWFYDEATFGLENRVPLGKPPVELNDHYTHVRPFLATSRTLRRWPSTKFYTNFSYDRSVKLTRRAPPPPEVTRRHIGEVAPGLLYKPGELGYFGEYRFRHFQEPNGTHLGHETQIGTIWDVPLHRSAKWKLPGKFTIAIAYKFTTEEGRDRSHGITTRVNWRTTIREVLDHVSNGENFAWWPLKQAERR